METKGIASNRTFNAYDRQQKIQKALNKEFIEYPTEINGKKTLNLDTLAEKMARVFCDEFGVPLKDESDNGLGGNIDLDA